MTENTLPHFSRFCASIGLELEPFQRRIVEELFSGRRELLVLLPRGNGKTTLFAAVALFHLVSAERPSVILAASSREQAGVAFDAAALFARHPALAGQVRVKSGYKELWSGEGTPPEGKLKVVSSDAPRAQGLQPTLALVDELHAHPKPDLYVALKTAMGKRAGAQLVTISTAGHDRESVLGRLRERAHGFSDLTRDGTLTVARDAGASFAMIEWACEADADLSDPAVLKCANPASFVSEAFLAEQVASPGLHPLELARYHANVWSDASASWLPPGAWQACAGEATIAEGERVWVGVDVGGSRAASAIVWVTADPRVGSKVFQGDGAVLEVVRFVRHLAESLEVVELIHDPWRFQQAALELAEAGMLVVQFPQTNERMVAAAERLYRAVLEGELTHPADPELDRHVATAIAKETPRGWRLDKASKAQQIDAAVALAMAVERASTPAPKVELLGWL